MSNHIKFFTGFIFRVLWVVSPLMLDAVAAKAVSVQGQAHYLHNDVVRGVATQYSDSLIIFLCLFVVAVGSVLGVFYPTPEYGSRPMPSWLKGIVSVTAGILAFAYYIDTKKSISPAVCIWVAGVSFVAPAILHLIHASAIKMFSMNLSIFGIKIKLTAADLKRIKKSFWGKE